MSSATDPTDGLVVCPITQADDEAMGTIARTNLAAYGLDIPGTAYFDPEIMHLSRYYAVNPEKRAYFVVKDGAGRVLGGAGFTEFAELPDTVELQKLYLDDGAKGHGLGTRLVRLVEDTARERGYRQVYLETHSNLCAAIHLYEKLGYRAIERPAFCNHSTMDLFYVKAL